MVLIVGATGNLGRATAYLLLERGVRVRVLVRSPQKAAALRQRGAEVVTGDLTDPASLARALVGVDSVLAAAHALLGRGKNAMERVDDGGHRALIDAARAAGVERFVYTSIYGAAPDHPVDFWRTKFAVEQYLKASGMGHTILRPTASMEHHAHEYLGKPILQRGATVIFGRGDNPTNFVASADVAALAARALTESGFADTTLEIGGPANFTKNEVAALYGRLAGRTPRVRHIPRRVLRTLSATLRPVHPGISRMLLTQAVVDELAQAFDGQPVADRYGLTPTPLEQFIRAQIAAAQAPERSA